MSFWKGFEKRAVSLKWIDKVLSKADENLLHKSRIMSELAGKGSRSGFTPYRRLYEYKGLAPETLAKKLTSGGTSADMSAKERDYVKGFIRTIREARKQKGIIPINKRQGW